MMFIRHEAAQEQKYNIQSYTGLRHPEAPNNTSPKEETC